MDHDDLLAPDKIEKQMAVVFGGDYSRTLLAGPFATFFFTSQRAKPVQNSMCQNLTPVEFFLNKFNNDSWLQIASYLIGRELTNAAGSWYEKQSSDDDGDYVARVVAASKRIEFVPDAKSYWRIGNTRSAGYRNTKQIREAAFNSTVRCINLLRSLEESERTRAACLRFLHYRIERYFYPEEPEIIAKLADLAVELGSVLTLPKMSRRFSLVENIVGTENAKLLRETRDTMSVLLSKNYERIVWRSLRRRNDVR